MVETLPLYTSAGYSPTSGAHEIVYIERNINSRRVDVIPHKRNVGAGEAVRAPHNFGSLIPVALLQLAGAQQVSSRLQLAREEDRCIEFVEAALAVEP